MTIAHRVPALENKKEVLNVTIKYEIDIRGLFEKETVTGRKNTYYVDSSDDIVAKLCKKCSTVREITSFNKHNRGLGKRQSECRKCESESRSKNKQAKKEYDAAYYERNASELREKQRITRENNPKRMQFYRENNRDKFIRLEQNRRARAHGLVNDFTDSQKDEMFAHFDFKCALTGSTDSIQIDHVIPLALGYGGTTKGNLIPLNGRLNSSKGTQNIFEWFNENKQRFNLSEDKFNETIQYLATLRGESVEEYTAYVYSCFTNKTIRRNA